jgi:hypothetical protein
MSSTNSERPDYMPGGVTGKGWKPGQSGNPGGRPKGRSVTALLRELLDQEHNQKKLAELLAERLLKEALTGKLGHIKEVLDRTEGKVADRVQIEGDEARQLVINLVRRESGHPLSTTAQERERARAQQPHTGSDT